MSGQEVEFPANGKTTRGYLAVPDSGSGPGVVVIQEWWGLVPHIQDVCDRCAREGFVALAPDLYHGEKADNPDDAGRMMMALQIDRAERDLQGAVRYLLERRETQGETVAVIGYCMGGQLALYAASQNPAIGACADYYGIHPNVQPDYTSIRCPVLGIFAEQDEFVTPDKARELEQKLQQAGVETDFTIYPGVGHAFFNDQRPDAYDADTAQKAWEKTLAFFRRHVPGGDR